MKRGPSDGEIYEAVSRKANPELFAALDAEVNGNKLTNGDKDWNSPCLNCDAVPTLHPTKLCGPCCLGEADTAGGNW